MRLTQLPPRANSCDNRVWIVLIKEEARRERGERDMRFALRCATPLAAGWRPVECRALSGRKSAALGAAPVASSSATVQGAKAPAAMQPSRSYAGTPYPV